MTVALPGYLHLHFCDYDVYDEVEDSCANRTYFVAWSYIKVKAEVLLE